MFSIKNASEIAKTAGAAVLVLSLTVACSPIVHQHGYTPRAAELDNVSAGVDTRESVMRKLGRPSTIGAFNARDWFYISMRSETYAFYDPEVTDQKVVLISFDETGVVSDVGRYGLEDGRVIDLVSRTTPTAGRKLTLLQQAFQNLGKYNTNKNILGTVTDQPGG